MTQATPDPSSVNHMLGVAQAAFKQGLKIIPITADGRKIPLRRWTSENGENQQPRSLADVFAYWGEDFWDPETGRNAGVAFITGPTSDCGSGLLVIDVDVKNGAEGPASLAQALIDLGPLPETLKVTSPSGGYHLVYRYPDESKDWRNWEGWRPGIDVRGWHGIAAAPGSRDHRGEYVGDGKPVAELPVEWLNALRKPEAERKAIAVPTDASDDYQRETAVKEIEILAERIRSWSGEGKHGNLKTQCFIAGQWLHHFTEPEQNQAIDLLTQAIAESHRRDGTVNVIGPAGNLKSVISLTNLGRVDPKWAVPGNGMGTTITHLVSPAARQAAVIQATTPVPSRAPIRRCTDTGNAERMVDRYADQFRHVHNLRPQPWFTYTGTHWAPDKRQSVMAAATSVARSIEVEVPDTDPAYEAYKKWSRQSEASKNLRSAVSLFGAHPDIAATLEDFDARLDLVNFTNGTLELATGVLRAPTPDDMLTKTTGFDYDPTATCPVWDAYLARAVPNADDRAFLARAVGYSLTGENNARAMFVLYGKPGTGKSKFIDGVIYAFGDYADTATTEALMKKPTGGISNDVKDMQGYRFISASESDHDQELNESLIKRLTGGDLVKARRLHENNTTFKPTGVLWLGTNNKPQIKGDDGAIWTRIYPVKFEVVIPLAQQDLQLQEKLKAERAGIFNWVLRGLADFRRLGLAPTQALLNRVEEYRDEQDPVRAFLKERLVITDPNGFTPNEVLVEEWEQWNKENHYDYALKPRRLGNRLEALGYDRDTSRDPHTHNGPRCTALSESRDVPKGCETSHQPVRGIRGISLQVRQDTGVVSHKASVTQLRRA